MALYEAFFVARATPPSPAAGGGGGGAATLPPPPRLAPFCRYAPRGVRAAGGAPTVENAVGFCFPLGADSVKPSAYLVTAEFTFTLTGGDGGRLHGICRRTHDPTYRPPPGERGTVKRWPQVLCILTPHCWQPFFSKALEVVEQLLAPHAGGEALPPDAPAALFLASLPAQLAAAAAGRPGPPLGAVLRVPLPLSGAPVVVDRMRRALAPPGQPGALLGLSADAIELEVGAGAGAGLVGAGRQVAAWLPAARRCCPAAKRTLVSGPPLFRAAPTPTPPAPRPPRRRQVPPDLGNGAASSGVSLARLLWFLTPRQAVTLVASLLLERRIILVARDADTVSAAVHAANALLYPFSWQHIYLPLLPLALKVQGGGCGRGAAGGGAAGGDRRPAGRGCAEEACSPSTLCITPPPASCPAPPCLPSSTSHTCTPPPSRARPAGLPGGAHAVPGGHPGRLPAAAARHAAGRSGAVRPGLPGGCCLLPGGGCWVLPGGGYWPLVSVLEAALVGAAGCG